MPGVEAAGITTNASGRMRLFVEGAAPMPDADRPVVLANSVSAGYAQAIGMRTVQRVLVRDVRGGGAAARADWHLRVMSYSVAQRTHEIGVRMALGAEPRTVVRMVVRQGMAIAIAGLLLGLAAALALPRVMTSLLYDVTPTDPATFTVVIAALAATALAACCVPALKAARVDPLVALRYE